ncbi:MAG: hypothetical protein ACLTSG_09720 [Lachnospiraceae bacterium]
MQKESHPEENTRREKIRELLQLANIRTWMTSRICSRETIAEFIENGLEAELDDELELQQIRLQEQEHRQQP